MTGIKLSGRAWRFEVDVNTDLIMPGKYLELVDPEEMVLHAMEGIDPRFVERVQEGDILVGGRNFGCGSSREQAPLALKHSGVGAVVAESFARIFYRNAINVGLPAFECRGIGGAVEEGDMLEIDVAEGTIVDADNGVRLNFSPMPGFMVDVLKEGGLVPYMRKQMGRW